MSELIISIIAIIALYGVLSLVGIGCPIKFLTGISCAGCGMTRAWKYLLTGRIGEAFSYHPLVLVPLFVVIIFILKKKIPEKIYKGMIALVVAMFLGVYLARMLNPNDTIVELDIKKGFLFQIVVEEIWKNFF